MPSYRILALDGGGIRGLYTAVLLGRLLGEVPGFTDRADLLAGTSAGGILALGLAKGISTNDLIGLYENNGNAIFSRPLWHEIRDLGDLTGAKYDNVDLIRIIQDTFREGMLDSLLPRHALAPSFDLVNQSLPPAPRIFKPNFFHKCLSPP